MITIQPFKGWRPARDLAEKVASPPYDVLSSEEAKTMASGNPDSFLRIIKPEIDLDVTDVYSHTVYEHARENWEDFKERQVFVQDDQPCFYLYRQSVGDHSQTGIVAASSVEDYFADRIKKHEFTRPKKENDRISHMSHLGIHPGPVFLTFKNDEEIDAIIKDHISNHQPENDFTAADGVRHTLWIVREPETIERISSFFRENVEATYIADGHHRAAASSKVGRKLKEGDNNDKDANYNYFLSVLFPDNQLKIIDYNRLVKDLNGLTTSDFLEKLSSNFEIQEQEGIYKPGSLHEFAMYLDKKWYKLTAHQQTYNDNDPIKCLDVTVLSDHLIAPVLGIVDQRTDERIDFVGGSRGLAELQKRVDSGEMAVAFALYPVSISQLINIADAGMVMPPKSTWFEPKLRSGLVVHEFGN